MKSPPVKGGVETERHHHRLYRRKPMSAGHTFSHKTRYDAAAAIGAAAAALTVVRVLFCSVLRSVHGAILRFSERINLFLSLPLF